MKPIWAILQRWLERITMGGVLLLSLFNAHSVAFYLPLCDEQTIPLAVLLWLAFFLGGLLSNVWR